MKTVIAKYKDLTRWDVKSFLASSFISSKEALLPISSFLEQRKKVFDDNELPIMLSVHFGGTISERKRKAIRGRLFVAHAEDFVFSKIDARNGALCMIPEQYEQVAFTSEFPIYKLKSEWRTKVSLQYLKLVLLSPLFLEILNSLVSGASGRKRITPDQFENIKIPIPDIKTQQKIVADFHKAKTQAERLQVRAEKKEKQIDEFLMRELGIGKIEHKKKEGAFVVNFKDLERWGVGFASWDWTLDNLLFSKKFELKKISQVAVVNPEFVFTADEKKQDISFIPMESVSNKHGQIVKTEIKKFESVFSGYTKFREGNIIFAKITPCMQNGKCAVAKNLKNNIGVGSTEFHVIKLNENIIIAEFLWNILRSNTLKESAQRFFIGSAGQQRVPDSFLKELKIPLPPLSKQKQIVEKVEKMREEVQKLRTESADILQSAKSSLQSVIVGK